MKDIEELPEDYSEQLHKTIGANVKRIRRDYGITQLTLSEALGYKSVSPISSAEIYYNKIHFNVEQLSKIAYVLNVDVCEFFKSNHSWLIKYFLNFPVWSCTLNNSKIHLSIVM